MKTLIRFGTPLILAVLWAANFVWLDEWLDIGIVAWLAWFSITTVANMFYWLHPNSKHILKK